MENEFVPYEIASAMKELGFDLDCHQFGYWYEYNGKWLIETPDSYDYGTHKNTILAPLYQQAFRWFRNNHGLGVEILRFPILNTKYGKIYEGGIQIDNDTEVLLGEFESYKEAELACLEKLIEIVTNKK